MTTIEITLPDPLAREAERAGLLRPERLEQWLREQLAARSVADLFAAMDRMAAVDEPAPMTAEELADEIRKLRLARPGKADQD